MSRACFITFEGGEGAGKTTQAARLAEHLAEQGMNPLLTREPGGTAFGEALRQVLLRPDGPKPTALAELLVIFAARAQHLEEVVRPALQDGRFVICDRFTDASFAYQGHGRGLGDEVISALTTLVHPDLAPDLTLLFDIDPDIGTRRRAGRGPADRFESERQEFFHRVREGYLARADAEPGRFHVINAAGSEDEVAHCVHAALASRLGLPA